MENGTLTKVRMCKCSSLHILHTGAPLSVYGKRAYKEVVESVSEESMQTAVEKAKAQPDYNTSGEVLL